MKILNLQKLFWGYLFTNPAAKELFIHLANVSVNIDSVLARFLVPTNSLRKYLTAFLLDAPLCLRASLCVCLPS